jgi:3-oxoacyl-[acyl-carrier-protein] synthase III
MGLNTVIESLGVYTPEGRLSTKELVDGCKVKPVFDLEELTGIKNRPMVAENEYALDLAREAATRCFEISKYQPNDIDLVICTNISRYNGPNWKASFEPSTAALLARDFDFSNAIIFDEPNACAGMFTALYIADAYLKAGFVKRAMVISGEALTCLARTAQKEMSAPFDPQMACLTVGDAGAAFILEQTDNPDVGFHDMDAFTVAEHCDYCIAQFSKEPHGGFVMYTDSIKIHQVAIGMTAEHVGRMVKGTKWENSENHHYIMHQTGTRAIKTTRKSINDWVGTEVCSEKNSIVNVIERGNSASTAHFVALWDHIRNGAIKSKENILFAVQSSGINLGVALYTLDDLPARVMNWSRMEQPEAIKEAM